MRPVAPHYVPLSRRDERTRTALRLLPGLILLGAGVVFGSALPIVAGSAWLALSPIVRGRTRRALRGRLDGVAGTLARDGDAAVAARSLESLIADSRGYPSFHSIALIFLGIARGRTGDAEGALDVLYAAHHGGWLSDRARWRAPLTHWLALMHAVLGDVANAQRWLDMAQESSSVPNPEGLVLPIALVALRAGHLDEAIEAIDTHLASPGQGLSDSLLLVRAFALDRAGRPLVASEVARLVDTYLAFPGRMVPLEKWWRDFDEFLGRNASQSNRGA